jgi:hypothetical protein
VFYAYNEKNEINEEWLLKPFRKDTPLRKKVKKGFQSRSVKSVGH